MSCPKLNFEYYLTFEIIFEALKPENSAFFDANCKIWKTQQFHFPVIFVIVFYF